MQEIDIFQSVMNTLRNDVELFKDYLSLGKILDTSGHKNAANKLYKAFALKLIEHESRNVNCLQIIRTYGLKVESMRLDGFKGPMEFVIAALYLSKLDAEIKSLLRNKARVEKRLPKPAAYPDNNAVQLLNWIKNGDKTSLTSMQSCEILLRRLENKSGEAFVTNMNVEEILRDVSAAVNSANSRYGIIAL